MLAAAKDCVDLPTAPKIEAVINAQLLSLADDHLSFRPDAPITVREMATAVAKALYGADLKIDHLQKAIDAGLLKASDLTDEPITATQVETLFAFLQDMQVVSVFATADIHGNYIPYTSSDGKFEIGVFSYPILEQQPEGEPENEYYTKYNVDRYVRRGLSGYSTGWGVTKTAMNKGDAVVEKCVDFLQFVTCYENNDRLINDKGFSIPLSGNTNYDYFRTLSSQYTADSANKKTLAWSAVTPGGCVNKSYYDAVYLMRIEIIKEKDSSKLQEKLSGLTTSLQQALNTLYKQNSWDRNSWPAYDGPAID